MTVILCSNRVLLLAAPWGAIYYREVEPKAGHFDRRKKVIRMGKIVGILKQNQPTNVKLGKDRNRTTRVIYVFKIAL